MTNTRKWNSVATQVWGMVLACAALLGLLLFVNTRTEMARERSVVNADLQRAGANESADIAELVGGTGTDDTLNSIASQPAVRRGGAPCVAALASIQKAITQGAILLVDGTGAIRCTAAHGYAVTGKALFSGTADLLMRIRRGVRGVDGPVVDPVTHTLSLYATVPVPGAKDLAVVYLSSSQELLSPVDIRASITSLVVDQRNGMILMHYPERKGVLGRHAAQVGLAAAMSATRNVTTAVGPDGVRRLYRSVRVPKSNFTVLVGVSEGKALGPVRASLRRNLLMGAAVILVVALMGLFLQRRVARPARLLRRSIQALATDPAAPPAPTTGPHELASVAQAFNTTTDARRRADGLSRAILEHASDLVLVLDRDGSLRFVGPEARRRLALQSGDELAGLLGRIHADDRGRVEQEVRDWLAASHTDLQIEARVLDSLEKVRSVDVRVQDLREDPAVQGVVLTCRDITERKAFEEHLAYQACHDSLTGLANRAAALDRLSADLRHLPERPVGVFFIDLDRFKLINDSHGHAVGDKLLLGLARRLKGMLHEDDVLARFGGDEFVIVTNRVRTPAAAEGLARAIRHALEQPVFVARRELFVSGSVGIALAEPGDDAGALLRNADTAMYRAKDHGRNCSAIFDRAMRARAQQLLRTESDLHRALERDQLVVHYQPVVEASGGRVVGVEALVRWNHPQHGLVAPGDFIPVAEETGLIVPIGAWVLRHAATWAVQVKQVLGRELRVSVNLSPRQLAQPDVVETVEAVLRDTGLAPGLLCLEVTESMLVQDAEGAARKLEALHALGVQLSIDDFGTGWSSLTYLQQFPVDEIKLDRSYISKIGDDATSETIIDALVGMAHAIGLSVTAEGVEEQGQLAFLNAHRCDNVQGYLFARPMPGPQVEALLTTAAGARIPLPRTTEAAEQQKAG